MKSRNLGLRIYCWVAALSLAGGLACRTAEADQGEVVTIKVVGVYRHADWVFLRDEFKELFSDPSNYSWGWSGNHVTVEAPTELTPEEIARRIPFSVGTRIEGQHIRVVFDETKQVPGPTHPPENQFNPDPVDPLGPALREHDGDMIKALKSIGASVKLRDGAIHELRLPSFKTTDATLSHLKDLDSLQVLRLPISKYVTDDGAKHLRHLTGLRELYLFGTRIGGPGQAHLSQLSDLRKLGLSGVGTEYGLQFLADLTNLESLQIGYGIGYPVTEDGLRHLQGMKELTLLRLDGCEISDGGLRMIANFRNLENLSIQKGTISGAGFSELSKLDRLERLDISGCHQIDDDDLSVLSHLINLDSLDLAETQVSDVTVREHLQPLVKLSYLNLHSTKVTDEAIEHLGPFKRMYSLGLSGTQITDSGIQQLPDLPRLHQLMINDTSIGMDSIKRITELSSLKSLWLANTNVDDEALAALSTMTQLRELELQGTRITDTGMQHVKQLKELREIDVRDTAVTLAGLKQLSACEKLYEITADSSQATYQQIYEITH